MQICAARRRQKINVKMLGLKQESRIQYQNTCTKQRAIRTDFPFGVSHHALRAFNNARSNPIGRTFPAHDQLSPMTGVTLRTTSTLRRKLYAFLHIPSNANLCLTRKTGYCSQPTWPRPEALYPLTATLIQFPALFIPSLIAWADHASLPQASVLPFLSSFFKAGVRATCQSLWLHLWLKWL